MPIGSFKFGTEKSALKKALIFSTMKPLYLKIPSIRISYVTVTAVAAISILVP